MTARQLAPVLVLALALPAELAFAQRSHGGRGGGHHGGGYAVPRGSSMGGRPSSPGGWSGGYGRHGGGSSWHGGGYNVGHHGGYYGGHSGRYYGRHYGSYYRPYSYGYRPYYGGYYGPYFSASLYWGSPYYGGAWPYYSTGPYYATGPSYGGAYYSDGSYAEVPRSSREAYSPRSDAAPAAPRGRAPASEVVVGESGQLRLEVRPEDTSVYLNDAFRGSAAEARLLTLSPGRHVVELVRPGYVIERHEVEVAKGERSDLLVELQRRP
jgi:hypothetical protein